MKRLFLCWVLLLQALLVLQASGAGLIVVDHWPPPGIPVPPPGPWPPAPPHWRPRPEPYRFAPLEVTSISVQAEIHDQIANTAIEQEFYNPNPTRLEGTFICPLPKGANISKFSMQIDGRAAEAELLPADKASSIYEDIVRRVKDPALLEYAGRDMVKVRIFPIEPRSKRKIVLKYTQLLAKDAGLISYSLPMSTEKYSPQPISNVVVKVELKTTQPLKSLYSPSHQVLVKRHDTRHATASYEPDSSSTAAPEDFVLYFAPEPDEIGLNVMANREKGEDGYFLLLASPGLSTKQGAVVARDVAFVIDTSGSMAGNKLEQAKKALEFCVENLNDQDRFQVIRFSTDVENLFSGLQRANKANREKAVKFTRDLRPMGGTAINDALKAALELHDGPSEESRSVERPFVVIFLTDGRPTVGETDEEAIVKNVKKGNEDKSRIFCFGIGTDVNTHLLDRITEQTRAVSQYVLPEEDLEVKLSSFYSKIKEPVLANPRLKTEGKPRVTQVYPSDMPDLFNGEQVVVVGRYKGSGDVVFTIEGTVNGKKESFTYEANLPENSSKYDFLPRLWATRRIGYLLDEIRLRGDNSELRDEVTALARKYGIVTPYTSYLIVEDEARRNVPREVRSLQRMEEDSAARREGGRAWESMQSDKSGLGATANAREYYAYKSANAPAAAASGGAQESLRALNATAAPTAGSSGMSGGGVALSQPSLKDDAKSRLAQYSQQAQFVANRTFFLNNGQWIDSTVQSQQNAKKTLNVQFGSKEYFELIRTNAAARPLVAVGRNVQFVLDDTIYQITD